MYHTINEFLEDWKYESEATLKVFQNLTDDSLNFRPESFNRTVGRLAWHITVTISEMLCRTGLEMEELNDNEYPKIAEEILNHYKSASDSLVQNLTKEWSDNSLNEDVNMYGETWTKEMILTSLVKHQIHHRAQITVLMREAGLKVPGIYGPSYEEWTAMGMEPMS